MCGFGRGGDARVRSDGEQTLEDELFAETAAEAPVEEAAGVLPVEWGADDILGFHATGAVVEVGELESDLEVDGEKAFFAGCHLVLDVGKLFLVEG